MSRKKSDLSRRDFLKKGSLTGLTAVALSSGLSSISCAQTESKPSDVKVPTRVYGKTKVPVSSLCLGGIFDITANLIVLKKALDMGVTYWDTANGYNGGNSELGIGMYFEKYPEARKNIFLVTKTGARNPDGMTKQLNLSLERMKTDYIDLYFVHGISSINEMTPEVKTWAENAKKSQKIKFMGFSTHNNMPNCLAGAPELGWVDGIMMTYNYRLMHEDNMKSAVEACQKAGIGLTAMKTQGGGPVKTDSDEELKFAGRFVQKGFTPEQAKLKAVWENKAIGSICSQMHNLTILMANAAAAADKTKLSSKDLQLLKQYAENTCSGYCAGCSEICESAMNQDTRIADVMRYMMYYRNYGDLGRAREEFAKLPSAIRYNLARLNYSSAESVCPQKLAIGRIMKEASDSLA